MHGHTPIKVAYIFDNFFPKLGGGPTQNRALVETLQKGQSIRPQVYPMMWARDLCCRNFKYPVKPIRVYPTFPAEFNRVSRKVLWDRFKNMLLSYKISSQLATADIIHTDLHTAALVGTYYRFRWCKRLVIRFGGNLFRENETRHEVEDKYHRLKAPFFEWPGRIALKAAHKIIVNGLDLKEELGRAGVNPSKIHVIDVGVDQKIFYPPPENDDNLPVQPQSPYRLLFFGRITEANGPLIFINILKNLTANGVALRATVVGEGPLLSEMKMAALKARLAVTFLGVQNHAKLAKEIRRAHFCVFPFRKIGGVSTVVIESMACGRIVFATHTGDLGRIIDNGRNGFLTNVDRPAEMVARILQVVGHPERQIRISRSAVRTIDKDFDWESIGKKYLFLYQDLLNRNHECIRNNFAF